MNGDISRHYASGGILDTIQVALSSIGLTVNTVTEPDLGGVGEFHVGGREATESFIGQLNLEPGQAVLDIGCGLGGAARFVASTCGARVIGIDLSPDFVLAGNEMSRWVGLDDLVQLRNGSALDLPFDDASLDAAYMVHVGMNISDKSRLCREVSRVLRHGSFFGIYDLVRLSDADLSYPVPWAANREMDVAARARDYEMGLATAGFELVATRDRRSFALDYYKRLRQSNAANGVPAIGLHLIMGAGTKTKLGNMIAGIESGAITPMELVARKH